MNDIIQNNVTSNLAAGKPAVSFQVRLVESIEIAQIAKSCGYDTLYIDLEHCMHSMHQTSQICMAALAVGITPFVRVPSYAPEYVSRVLDGGAMGIIAPHVSNRNEAERVVAAAKFPPLGDRSVSIGLPQLKFQNYPLAEARRELNAKTTVVTMLEGPDAVDNAEEIAAVEGVDILFIGTNDLCAQLGIDGQFDHPKVKEIYAHVTAVARKHGKHVGVGGLSGHPELLTQFVKMGALYISAGSDLQYMVSGATARTKLLRSALNV
ncbi:HpcH/HpaI aldolase family protein [Candidimonas nitroreducens]|uniref:HpcH/HpaI aldolase family protein n=1 Tax=Candidimonas nitroreducens TaxID=683354 RepID=UPI001E634253|nr:aldolase/citrate lyase family protein [Candidimonas nitroreducens]